VDLWSNPGDIVFSPFMGIGSEGYQSVIMDRFFVGVELKHSYYQLAGSNLDVASNRKDIEQITMFT
jgi:DNA modification methylase